MFKGTVQLRARIKGNGLTFPLFNFNPDEPGVDRVEIEGPSGNEVLGSVHLTSVASQADGLAIARKVIEAALNRICFFYGVAIENGQVIDTAFSPIDPQPGVFPVEAGHYAIIGAEAKMEVNVPPERLRALLEQASPPGERNFALFRLARQSSSPVEEFTVLYSVLLMLLGDRQASVDTFILRGEPSVPRTPDPRNAAVMETVYTRLRNELAHRRPGVDLRKTVAEMAANVGGLRTLTRRAIELHP